MALKLTVEKLEDVEEPFRPLYEEKDGKFALAVDGLEDSAPLKKALESARRAEREIKRKVEAWEKLGKTSDEIEEMIRAHEDAERKKAEDAGDHAKILKQHQDKWAKEKSDIEAELNAARASERAAIIGNSIMAALTKEGATEEGLDLLPDRLAGRIKFETKEGKRVLRIMHADGETPMAGGGAEGSATIDDLVKEAQGKWPSLFKGSGNSGGGSTPPKGAGSKPGMAGVKSKRDLSDRAKLAAFVNSFPSEQQGLKAYADLPTE